MTSNPAIVISRWLRKTSSLRCDYTETSVVPPTSLMSVHCSVHSQTRSRLFACHFPYSPIYGLWKTFLTLVTLIHFFLFPEILLGLHISDPYSYHYGNRLTPVRRSPPLFFNSKDTRLIGHGHTPCRSYLDPDSTSSGSREDYPRVSSVDFGTLTSLTSLLFGLTLPPTWVYSQQTKMKQMDVRSW